jgi:tight adherence protein C
MMDLGFIIDWLIENDGPILISSMITAVVCTLFVYRALLHRDPLQERLGAITDRQNKLKSEMGLARSGRRREQSLSFLRRQLKRLDLLKSKEAAKVTLELARAGFRSKDALTIFFFLKLSLPFVCGGLGVLFIYVLPVITLGESSRLLAAMICVVIGAYLPNLYLRNAQTKRQQALRKGVPDALDLLVICAEAGQSLDAALARVAKETARFCPEMAEELALTSMELGLMPERRVALDNLVERTGLKEIKNVVNALMQTEKYGTPLSQSLKVLANDFRQERLMRGEEKAARLPAIMTIPMIIFILPPLFVVLLGPAVLSVLDMFANF